jgi:hypothetical protein
MHFDIATAETVACVELRPGLCTPLQQTVTTRPS